MPATPWNKIANWSPATNTPTLTPAPAINPGDYYECTDDGTVWGIDFQTGDYLWTKGDGSWQKLDANDPLTMYVRQARTYLNGLIDQGTTAINNLDARVDVLEAKTPTLLTPIVGGSQATTSVNLSDVTGSTFNLAASTPYEVEWSITHSAAATTTGAWFSVNGTAVSAAAYFTAFVIGDTLAADGSARHFNAANGGSAFASSRATTLNKVLVRAIIRTTTAGTALLRFASEVNGSAITVTALQGYQLAR